MNICWDDQIWLSQDRFSWFLYGGLLADLRHWRPSVRCLVLNVDLFLIIFHAATLPIACEVYNYSCHKVRLFYSYFPNSPPLLHVLSSSHCIILMIIHACGATAATTTTSIPTSTHPLALPFPSSLALKEGRTRERKERERESEMGKGKLWSGFPSQWVCRPSPRDVSPLPRGNRKITFRMVMITY